MSSGQRVFSESGKNMCPIVGRRARADADAFVQQSGCSERVHGHFDILPITHAGNILDHDGRPRMFR